MFMKRIQKLSAVMLALIITAFTAIPVLAEDNIRSKISEINDYSRESISDYGLYGVPEIQAPVDGEVYLTYTSDSVQIYEDTLRKADNLISAYYQDEESFTLQDFDDCMTDMIEAERGLVLERENLSFLLDLCSSENNDNNYYSPQVWNKFTDSVEKAQMIIEDETISDIRVNNAYWDLFNSFSSLCVHNKLVGDVNFNGKVDIIDATLIQRALAKLTKLNISQLNVANVDGRSFKLDITQATHIQRHLAKLDNIDNSVLTNVLEYEGNFNAHNYKENKYFYEALFRSYFPFY